MLCYIKKNAPLAQTKEAFRIWRDLARNLFPSPSRPDATSPRAAAASFAAPRLSVVDD
jgi:hypothetical protein